MQAVGRKQTAVRSKTRRGFATAQCGKLPAYRPAIVKKIG